MPLRRLSMTGWSPPTGARTSAGRPLTKEERKQARRERHEEVRRRLKVAEEITWLPDLSVAVRDGNVYQHGPLLILIAAAFWPARDRLRAHPAALLALRRWASGRRRPRAAGSGLRNRSARDAHRVLRWPGRFPEAVEATWPAECHIGVIVPTCTVQRFAGVDGRYTGGPYPGA